MAIETVAMTVLSNGTTAIGAGIAAGLLRNIAGWLENACKDNKIDKYEITQLVGTCIQYICYIGLLMTGLPVEQAVVASFGLDAIKSSLNKIKTG